ncbi:MAG TPA: CGNR zinc finger domain-containing protein [Solirubrobacteraceae bacterium]|nr:CGNR zinc finger domain-containing protein [Solirubrobacteraceae bacterium]
MSNPAPGRLETVRAFVNTLDIDDALEELATPEQLAGWLAEHELLAVEAPLAGEDDVRHAVELREALRAHLFAHHGDPLDPAAARVLDAAACRAQLTLRFTGDGETTYEPAASGVDGALGRLLAIVKGAIDDGTWQRMKACPAETCQWAFYDESRNRSAVWCDMRVCGNRAKVRGFRERHADHT